jgi:hypothetical protein
MEMEQQTAQLNAVLKSTNGAAGVTAAEVTAMADAFEKSTKFAAESVLAGQNLLLTFTKVGADVFPQATQAMVDMATGTKSVIYGDFSKYYVRKVGTPIIGVRREYYWPNIGLAGVVRLDGDLIQTGAVKHILQA